MSKQSQIQLRKFKTRVQAVDVITKQLGYMDGPEVTAPSYKEAKEELYKQSPFIEIYAEIIETVELKYELEDPFIVRSINLPEIKLNNQ